MNVTLEVSALSTSGWAEQAVHAVGTPPSRRSRANSSPWSAQVVGKTTLLAMIGGLLRPTAGAIVVNGRDIAEVGPRAGRLPPRHA
jgi:ABC-type antimicrobial peptide transport system ATPase subunit